MVAASRRCSVRLKRQLRGRGLVIGSSKRQQEAAVRLWEPVCIKPVCVAYVKPLCDAYASLCVSRGVA